MTFPAAMICIRHTGREYIDTLCNDDENGVLCDLLILVLDCILKKETKICFTRSNLVLVCILHFL